MRELEQNEGAFYIYRTGIFMEWVTSYSMNVWRDFLAEIHKSRRFCVISASVFGAGARKGALTHLFPLTLRTLMRECERSEGEWESGSENAQRCIPTGNHSRLFPTLIECAHCGFFNFSKYFSKSKAFSHFEYFFLKFLQKLSKFSSKVHKHLFAFANSEY
jgi:hypothetical protein